MKSITQILYSLILGLSLIIGMSTSLSAQSGTDKSASASSAKSVAGDQTLTLVVAGVCEMCKARIESTAMDVSGVKKAEWDVKTDTLVLVGSSKMDIQKVADALAKAGYRSELAKADEKGYKKLPACCQYDNLPKKQE
jgi:mercuric ion binding protein